MAVYLLVCLVRRYSRLVCVSAGGAVGRNSSGRGSSGVGGDCEAMSGVRSPLLAAALLSSLLLAVPLRAGGRGHTRPLSHFAAVTLVKCGHCRRLRCRPSSLR